jgi:hypothetical protein
MSELSEALEEFRARFIFYSEKVKRKYHFKGDIDCDVVSGAWVRYLRLRKQQEGKKLDADNR